MALLNLQTYKYHELIDKFFSLYKVSKDEIHFGITNSQFINGAIEGLKTALNILPYIIGIFLAIEIFKSGRGIEIFSE